MKPTVVIATYNERENIGLLLDQILALAVTDLRIIVVDDGSPDGTAEVVQEKMVRSEISLIVRRGERGYGSAHVRGFQEAIRAGADVIISMDADFSHQPAVIPVMLQSIAEGADVVVGSRRVPGGSIIGWGMVRKAASQTAMLLTRLILGIKTRDVTTGFRAYRVSALQRLDLETVKSNGYSFLQELIFRCERAGLKVREVPIQFNDRERGKSKFSIREILKFFITLLRLRMGRR